LGRTEDAGKYFKILLKSLPFDHPNIASVYSWMGVVYHKQKQLHLAQEYYKKAYTIRQERLPADHPRICDSLYDFAVIAEEKTDLL
jgi:tetratricopeptide (TPR) repeat protein